MKIPLPRIFATLGACLCCLFSPASLADAPYKVAILLFDEVQIIDFAAPYEVFGQADYEVFTVSKDGKTVTTAMSLSVNPDYSFANIPDTDAILVPGGDVHTVMQDEDVQAWLIAMQKKSEHILSVCTGAHILAQSGLLKGKAATTFHRALDSFERDYPDITVKRAQRFVDNGQIITSAGLSSGIDAALHLVSEVSGMNKARTVAMHIEYDWQPESGFVRATMADQFYPNNHYNWPEGIKFDQLYSFGDESNWTMAFSVKTHASANELKAVYSKAMAAHGNWQSQESSDPTRMIWQGSGDRQGWTHEASLSHAGDDDNSDYAIALSMHRAD